MNDSDFKVISVDLRLRVLILALFAELLFCILGTVVLYSTTLV